MVVKPNGNILRIFSKLYYNGSLFRCEQLSITDRHS